MDLAETMLKWGRYVTRRIASYLRTPVERWTLAESGKRRMNSLEDEVVIGPNTSVTGSMKAEKVTVKGRVDGRVTASLITINRMGTLEGRVFAESFDVAKHATLDARCRIRQNTREETTQKQKRRTQKT